MNCTREELRGAILKRFSVPFSSFLIMQKKLFVYAFCLFPEVTSESMVLKLDSSSEIGAHVNNNLCDWIS